MRPLIRLCLLLAFAVAPPAVAAPIDDANAAYQRGNYAAAEKILLPLAEGGIPPGWAPRTPPRASLPC